MTPDDWLDVLNRIMRDVIDFAATGDYRLAGALVALSSEARQAAGIVRAQKTRRGKVSKSAPVD